MSKPFYKNVAFWILVIFPVFLVVLGTAIVKELINAVRATQKEKEEGDIEGCLYPLNSGRATAWVLSGCQGF